MCCCAQVHGALLSGRDAAHRLLEAAEAERRHNGGATNAGMRHGIRSGTGDAAPPSRYLRTYRKRLLRLLGQQDEDDDEGEDDAGVFEWDRNP